MKLTGIALFIYVAIIIAAIIGEVKCIIKFFSCDFEPSYKAEMIYAVGSLSGLGSVIGYMDFGK